MNDNIPRTYTSAEAISEAQRCLNCSEPTCIEGCPIGVNIQEFIREIATGNLTRAARLLVRKNPFYWSCAYVCPVEIQCESKCRNKEINYPVTIARLQQYIASADQNKLIFQPEFPEPNGKKVAVIGAGPAGLTCAWQLASAGIESTVFEKRRQIGGMLEWAIPDYRLPRNVVTDELKRFDIPLIDLKIGQTPGVTAVELLSQGFDAVFIAAGLQESFCAKLPGEENALFALDFLNNAYQGTLNCKDKNVLVIGGGNVAMDICGTALKSGAEKVELVCLEAPNEMPACKNEIDMAWTEGVIFHTRLMPKEIVMEDGAVKGLKAISIEWKEPDRFIPSNAREIEGSERFIPCSLVVEAIGQRPDNEIDQILEGIDRGRDLISVDQETMLTNISGIYAGGDLINGGGTVANAVDHGNRAAKAIIQNISN